MRAHEKILLVVGVVVLVLAAGCGSPFVPSAGKDGSDGYSVVVESLISPTGARGLMDDATVTTVTVFAYNASHVQVGNGSLTKGVTSWNGIISVSATGSIDFLATAFNAATDELWVGEQMGANITGVNDSVSIVMRAALTAVNLGTAGNYVILSETGITNASTSAVTGNMGVSPIGAAAITGFALVPDGSGTFSTSVQVTGSVYAADYAAPTPANLTTAVGALVTAYNDAAGRTSPYQTDLGTGNLGGLTLVPGLYKWTTAVTIPTGVTLLGGGGAKDVWIFQIAGTLNLASSTAVTLAGGALSKNVFWQVAGATTLGTTSNFKGVILDQTAITLGTGATVNGRLLAQTAVNLDGNTVTQPAP